MNGNIRIGHFSPDAPNVNVMIDGDLALEDVPFRTLSDYMEIEAGSLDLAIVPVGGDDAVIEATLDVDADADYTVLAIGTVSEIEPLVLTDDLSAVGEDESRVRLVHLVPDAPAVDVSVRDGPTLFESVSFGEFGEFVTVDAAEYDLDVTPSGDDDVVLSLSESLDGGAIYTVFAIGTLADGIDAMVSLDAINAKKPVRG
jgi:hypothetical protein